jgi:hypothetical protein
VVCHGIPDNRQLQEGDIINVDVTVFKDGYHGDTNATFFVGEWVWVCGLRGGVYLKGRRELHRRCTAGLSPRSRRSCSWDCKQASRHALTGSRCPALKSTCMAQGASEVHVCMSSASVALHMPAADSHHTWCVGAVLC